MLRVARLQPMTITQAHLRRLDSRLVTAAQMKALHGLSGRQFQHAWQLEQALGDLSADWRPHAAAPGHQEHNEQLARALQHAMQVLGPP